MSSIEGADKRHLTALSMRQCRFSFSLFSPRRRAVSAGVQARKILLSIYAMF
ncbi:MAG: hypothetical protein U0J30_09310 [Megasphaera sp.]|nr:hypothetical protein [Megasphaera sp.]